MVNRLCKLLVRPRSRRSLHLDNPFGRNRSKCADRPTVLRPIDGSAGRRRTANGDHPQRMLRAASRSLFDQLQIFGRRFAVLARLEVIRDLLTFMKAVDPGALERGNMHEGILRAVFRLNESEASGRAEELNCSSSHSHTFVKCNGARRHTMWRPAVSTFTMLGITWLTG